MVLNRFRFVQNILLFVLNVPWGCFGGSLHRKISLGLFWRVCNERFHWFYIVVYHTWLSARRFEQMAFERKLVSIDIQKVFYKTNDS